MEKPEIVLVYGPTASGKTEKAVELADKLNGEIVSIDSVQVYRYMNIGTAKPDRAVQIRFPHHMIDLITPNQQLNAQSFASQAHLVIREIVGRGKLPILAGGTGLYFKALLEGFFDAPRADPVIREKYSELVEKEGKEALRQKLIALDPDAAKTIHPNNIHRMIRAIEICELSGQTLTELKMGQTRDGFYRVRESHFLCPNRDLLAAAIEQRTNRMFELGLVEEVRSLLACYDSALKAFGAIGYKEIAAYLSGRISLDQAREQIKMNTRQYAKRQMTWFSNQKIG